MTDGIQATGLGLTRGAVVPLELVQARRAEVAVAEEQLVYARVLDTGMKIGLLLLFTTFVVYLSGALVPHVRVTELPRYWSLPVKEYLAATGTPAGWAWIQLLGKGDFLNFVPIAFLAGTAIACYATVCPMFFRKKDVVYGWLTVVEVLVLALAASGLLNAGGH
jgi:hypothetical protein